MKKQITAFLTALAMMPAASAGVFADGDKVEISFKVGDSTLLINGSPTTVETPYVAGEGTTLVPLRVITEAFGAQVEWDGSKQEITLNYPDVDVVLQIGNKTAHVNDHTETLAEAPALSENGVTMVPLRFLSETFGATVSYDNATQAILVTKETVETEGTLIGTTDMVKIGDSTFGWSINTPTDMTMTKRTFGGLSTVFEDENSKLQIGIVTVDEDRTSDTVLEDLKSSFSGATLVKADKNASDANGNNFVHFQARDSESFIDIRIYLLDDFAIEVDVICSEEADEKNKVLAYADSFTASGFDASNTHDLSSLNNDGTRTFTNEKYGITMNFPKNYAELSSTSAENIFTFGEFGKNDEDLVNNKIIRLSIYSKSEGDAKTLAQRDYESNIAYFNKDYVTAQAPSGYSFNGYSGYKYTWSVEGADNTLTDIFFDLGDYTYNLSFQLPEGDESTIPQVVNSFKAQELDSSKIGTLIKNAADESVLMTHKTSDFSVKAPSVWEDVSLSSDLILLNIRCGAQIVISDLGMNAIKEVELKDFIKYLTDSTLERYPFAEMVDSIRNTNIGKRNWHSSVLKRTDDDGNEIYITNYVANIDGETITVSLVEPAATYGGKTADELKAMLESITIL